MANPTTEVVEWINANDRGGSPVDAASTLNELLVDNPTPAPTIRLPVSWVAIVDSLTAAGAQKFAAMPDKDRVFDVLQASEIDADTLGGWVNLLIKAGIFQKSETDAVQALISATGPDPDWPARIRKLQNDTGVTRTLDVDDVISAREAV